MKIFQRHFVLSFLAPIIFVTAQLPSSASPCVQGGFDLQIENECSFDTILQAFTIFFGDEVNRGPSCSPTRSAEEELLLLLGVSDRPSGETKVSNICQLAYTNYANAVPFDLIHQQEAGFLQKFFNGRGSWNTQTATLYPLTTDALGQTTLHRDLDVEVAHLRSFYETHGQYGLVQWPSDIPNFETCEMNAVYCCWPRDRQAMDGNGNCDVPYDVNCIDRDPMDNTDLCFVDGEQASFVFPNDDPSTNYNNAEGAIHCHGTAWSEDPNHPSAAFKGNNLFYITMYDHLYQRGYVNNIPGAPMCACAEQMPVVSRSDCTEMEVTQTFEIIYSGLEVWTARLLTMNVDFNSCTGFNMYGEEKNNDLWAYMNKLYMEDRVSAGKLTALTEQIVGYDNCRDAEQRYMATQNDVVVGYNPSGSWVQLAGREHFEATAKTYGKFSFRQLFDASPTKILERICGTCFESHQHVFYKRLTPVPDTLDLLNNLKYSKEQVADQVHGVDFKIYGSYEDAISGANAFICPKDGYHYNEGFPGDCGPHGETKDQDAIFQWWGGNQDVAYFLNATSPFVESEDDFVGDYPTDNGLPVGGTFEQNGLIYLASNSKHLWDTSDVVYFKHESRTGDVDIRVKVEAFHYESVWAKVGIMVRDSMDGGSKHYSILVTGANGVFALWRSETDDSSASNNDSWDNDKPFQPVWLRLLKQGTIFTSYMSDDGTNWNSVGDPITIDINGSNEVGLFHSGDYWDDTVFEVVFSNYEIEDHQFPSAAPSTTPAPSGFLTVPDADVGHFQDNFDSTVSHSPNSDLYEVTTSGHGMWGNEDSFNFINFQRSNDFTVTVFVESIESDNEWAKGGVMIRQSLDADSANVFTQLSKDHGTFMSMRETKNGDTNSEGITWGQPVQSSSWVRLKKVGDSYTGYRSMDGINWNAIATVEISMGSSNLYVGIACTSSHGWAWATGTFRYLEITN